MRKILFIVCLAGTIIAGCSKEKNIEQFSTTDQSAFEKINVITYNNGLKTGTTMLEFASIQTFDTTLYMLEQQMRIYDSSFYAQYGYLSEEAYDAKQTELGYNEQTPLIEFESLLPYSNTMRQVYVALENDWLSKTELDISAYPKIDYPFSLAEMTVLNSDGEVKIGNCILKLTKNGYLWITDGSFTTLSSFNNGDTSVLNLSTVITNLNESSGDDCASWKGKDFEDPYASGKKVIKHVHHHSYPWKWTESAEITSYKQTSNGWKKYAVDLGVSCQSYFRTSDCLACYQVWSGWKRKHEKGIEKNNTIWGNLLGLRAENGASVYGGFEYPDHANSLVLTW